MSHHFSRYGGAAAIARSRIDDYRQRRRNFTPLSLNVIGDDELRGGREPDEDEFGFPIL